MIEENKKGATSSTTEYDAPKIEEVVTAESLKREVQYAAVVSGPKQ